MSLILDALRKSEAERRRGQAPDLYASLPPGVPNRGPHWARWWPALVLVALTIAAAMYFLAEKQRIEAEGEGDSAPRSEQPSAAVTARSAATVLAPPSPAADPGKPGPGVPAANATPSLARNPPQAAAPTAMQGAEATAHAATPAVAVPPSAESVVPQTPEDDALPPIAVLSAGERAALPPLKLSMHVFAREPDKRFAIIDGQRVTEGAILGPSVVEQIRRDGVVLNINGRRVLLPRP